MRFRPCRGFSARILRAWSDCAHLLTTCWQCSLTDSLLLIVTTRIFRLVTHSIPGSFDGGECGDLPLPLQLVIMISLVFLWFSFKLLVSAHCSTFWSSAARVWILLAGICYPAKCGCSRLNVVSIHNWGPKFFWISPPPKIRGMVNHENLPFLCTTVPNFVTLAPMIWLHVVGPSGAENQQASCISQKQLTQTIISNSIYNFLSYLCKRTLIN